MSNNVQLGKSDLYVNPIGLGTNAVGGHNLYPNLSEEQGKRYCPSGNRKWCELFGYGIYVWNGPI